MVYPTIRTTVSVWNFNSTEGCFSEQQFKSVTDSTPFRNRRIVINGTLVSSKGGTLCLLGIKPRLRSSRFVSS